MESCYYLYDKLVIAFMKESADTLKVFDTLNGISEPKLLSEV
jgi:hypothetical protein